VLRVENRTNDATDLVSLPQIVGCTIQTANPVKDEIDDSHDPGNKKLEKHWHQASHAT